MSAPPANPVATVKEAIAAAVAGLAEVATEARLERPPRPELGDYSTNAAMLAAPLVRRPPREVAAELAGAVAASLGEGAERIEVAGPGFLNLHMSERWMRDAATAIAAAGPAFGSGVVAEPRTILVEFVSANPTGPVTVASGRHAAYGDALVRLLGFAGHRVGSEYYLNDAGGQVRLFGESIAARIAGRDVPEGGYEGDYVAELGARIAAEGGVEDAGALARRGVELMVESIAASLERARVSFDRWSSEQALHESGAIEATIADLRGRGLVYESEGAVWLRTTDFGDDKDRVLIKADGEPTYFAPDIAYHRDKLERGFDLLIDVWGADHHGYVPRMQAAIAAFGEPEGTFEVEIMQLVNLIEGGERARMSKRRGDFATLDDLLDDVGVDAARFFLVQRSHETPLDIDLDLARKQSADNPVYYVQYAHARICSLFRAAAEQPDRSGQPAPAASMEPAERLLIARLLEFPEIVAHGARVREPHSIGVYLREVAADFHAFYRDCRVVGAGPGLQAARLDVCAAARAVLASGLELLGIEAPEAM